MIEHVKNQPFENSQMRRICDCMAVLVALYFRRLERQWLNRRTTASFGCQSPLYSCSLAPNGTLMNSCSMHDAIQVALPLGSKLDSASLAYGAALLAESGECLEGQEPIICLVRINRLQS